MERTGKKPGKKDGKEEDKNARTTTATSYKGIGKNFQVIRSRVN